MVEQNVPDSQLVVEDGVLKDKTPAAQTAQAVSALKLAQQANAGANWFFWIAGLSVVNSIINIAEFGIFFPVGLGVTQIIDAFALLGGPAGQGIGLFMGAVVASVFVLFGVMARKGQNWAFIAGLVLYGADALLFVMVQDWLSIGFHLWGCFGIYSGLKAAKQLAALPARSVAR